MRHILAQAEDVGHQAHDAIMECGSVEEAAVIVRKMMTGATAIALRSQEDRRERLAGQAMTGIARAYILQEVDDYTQEWAAVTCVELADALITELDKEEKE